MAAGKSLKTSKSAVRPRSSASARSQKSSLASSLGEFLARSRDQKQLTLSEVADAVGLKSGQSVWDWENGKGSGIPANTLLKLVKLYEVSAEEAYQLLLHFHLDRVERKIQNKFESARQQVFGRKRR